MGGSKKAATNLAAVFVIRVILCILGDPGAVSRVDKMFVVKVFCKIDTMFLIARPKLKTTANFFFWGGGAALNRENCIDCIDFQVFMTMEAIY